MALEKYILTGEIKPGSGIDPDKMTRDEAREAVHAMGYQICKEIGALAAVLEGKVDAIVLTGGLAYDKVLVPEIKRRVGWIAQILSYPGGDEMTALRTAAETALRHPNQIKKY